MASADYRLCDKCAGKSFYDANLNYEQGGDIEGSLRNAGTLMSNTSLDRLGDWTVLCNDCAKTHMCVIVPRALSAQQPEPDWEAALDRATDRIVAAQQTEAVACPACDLGQATCGYHVRNPQPQVAVSGELVRRVLDGLPDCPPTENDVRIALTAALRPDATP